MAIEEDNFELDSDDPLRQNRIFWYYSIMVPTSTKDQSQANTKAMPELKRYTGIAAKIMNLLASGVGELETAKACGVDASLVSQYKAEPDFMAQLHEKINIAMQDAVQIDENYVQTEKTLSQRLKDQSHLMFDPNMVLRTLAFLNKVQRKTQPVMPGVGNTDGIQSRPVTLVLPTVIVKQYVKNPNNEILGVGEKSLNTLNSTSLNQVIKERKNGSARSPVVLENHPKANGSKKNVDPYSDL